MPHEEVGRQHRASRLRRDLIEQSPENPTPYQRMRGAESKKEGEDQLMGEAIREANKKERRKTSHHPLLRRIFDL